jgi:hypothetical protein
VEYRAFLSIKRNELGIDLGGATHQVESLLRAIFGRRFGGD